MGLIFFWFHNTYQVKEEKIARPWSAKIVIFGIEDCFSDMYDYNYQM